MTKKKKILLFTLLGMLLITACWGYLLWDRNKKTEAVVTWIEEQGGTVEVSHPKWIDKWPSFTQETLKGIIGADFDIKLHNTQVSDIGPLKNLKSLVFLDLTQTEVIDISPLENLTNLEFLNLTQTQVSDISPLKNHTKLQSLYLLGTGVSDISALENLTNLLYLGLAGKSDRGLFAF